MIISDVKNIRSWFCLFILSSLIIIGLMACSSSEPVAEVKLGNLLIEYPGVRATGPLYWSPDDTMLLWQGYLKDSTPLYLTNIQTLTTRKVEVDAWIENTRMSGDGKYLLYNAAGDQSIEDPCWHRYSLSTGEDEMMLCDVFGKQVVSFSPDNIHVAYSLSGGGVYLYNLTTKKTQYLTDGFLYNRATVTDQTQLFSPDGSQLLVLVPKGVDTHTFEVSIITVATGNAEPLAALDSTWQTTILSWTTEGIQILFIDPSNSSHFIRNLTTGETELVWQDGSYYCNGGWSVSGNVRRLAFSTSRCLKSEESCSWWYGCHDHCLVTQHHLNFRDLSTGKAHVVAKYDDSFSLTSSLNHGGIKIAYYTATEAVTRIYVDEIPE